MILADPRVGSKQPGQRTSHDLTEHLTNLGAEVELTSLEYGDFAFVGNGPDGPVMVGIELKTVQDFISSMLSGRLAGHQIPGLLAAYGRVYLIVEGFYRANRRSGVVEVPRGPGWQPLRIGSRPIFWSDLERFITGLEEAGVRVRRTRTSAETARVIVQVLRGFWSKEYADHKSLGVLYRPEPLQLVREDDVTHRLRLFASILPGIGHGRSRAVAQKFRSIEGACLGNVEDWRSIDGIGKTIAEGAWKAIREEIPGKAHSDTVRGRRLSARAPDAPRSPQHSRRRQGTRVAPDQRPQRGVRGAGSRHRGARRGKPE